MKPNDDEPLSNFAFKFNLRRYSKELVRVLMAGGPQSQTAATVALMARLLTRDAATMEDIFHATRAACRIGAFDDSHHAFVDMVPSAELEALLHGRAVQVDPMLTPV